MSIIRPILDSIYQFEYGLEVGEVLTHSDKSSFHGGCVLLVSPELHCKLLDYQLLFVKFSLQLSDYCLVLC